MISIDGSYGEGGGQILRSSLSLSLITGKPFNIENIRANRQKPGLMRQHLTAVNAAATICNATVNGNSVGSKGLSFTPGKIRPGRYHFGISTAGSCCLVLQTLLPALLMADGPSEIILEGGTHNPFAPPYDFLKDAFLPLIHRMGPEVKVDLERYGFYPAGGGKFSVAVTPAKTLEPIDLDVKGNLMGKTAIAIVSKLPPNIAHRELKIIKDVLNWEREALIAKEIKNSNGPGNILVVKIAYQNVCEVFTGFGQRGVRAEKVAQHTVDQIQTYLNADVSVGRYLADQLLIPMAMCGKGRFTTVSPTEHTRTNADIIGKFLDTDIEIVQQGDSVWEITVKRMEDF